MTAALAFENVSKAYRGGREYAALRDDLVRGIGRLVGFRRSDRAVVNALDDVSFTIDEGESVAIIGDNGAGKTTALKLATRISYPSSGTIRVRGRVGALIEVGTGMHPELTGRENVSLYGQILGLTRRDTERRFEEIVEFAGVGAAIDQPVKQYSSGMQLRLGFSIAAHLEPDLLIVDEAIAVGDAGFQYRCVERMSEIVRDGRTLVFVSHDMSAVEVLCPRTIMLDHGRIADDGPTRDVAIEYMRSAKDRHLADVDQRDPASTSGLSIKDVTFHDPSGRLVDELPSGESVTIRVHFSATRPIDKPALVLGIRDASCGVIAIASMTVDGSVPLRLEGDGWIDCDVENLPLQPQTYQLFGEFRGALGYGVLVDWGPLRTFKVVGSVGGAGTSAVTHTLSAPLRLRYHWDVGFQPVRPEPG